MPSIPLNKLLELTHAEHGVEVCCAALRVIVELGLKDGPVVARVLDCLDATEGPVREMAIQAVGRLKIDAALPRLLDRLTQGGVESELAAQAAARLGVKGTNALQGMLPKVAPGLRRYIAAALASSHTASADAAAIDLLFDRDSALVEATTRTLSDQIPTLSAGQRRSLADRLLELAGGKKASFATATLTAVVRLLGLLDPGRAESLLWNWIQPAYPAEVRTHALQALGARELNTSKEHLQRLIQCALDGDFHVAATALLLLQRLPVTERSEAAWLPLLSARDPAVRKFALERLGPRDSPEIAAAMGALLHQHDRTLRDAALACLTKTAAGRNFLVQALLNEAHMEMAWHLARGVAAQAMPLDTSARAAIFKTICAHVESGDRRADPLLFLLREHDPADLTERLRARATHWRKKKNGHATAVTYLAILARDPACGFPIRLELACCGLKLSPLDVSAQARAQDPCLRQFAILCQQDEPAVVRELAKAKWLDAEALYYLGFHFAEAEPRYRRFGSAVLDLVVQRSPKTKLGQAAKSKRRSLGIDKAKK